MKIFIVSIRTIALDKGISEGPGCRKVVALNSYLLGHLFFTPGFFITQCLLFHILNLDP